MEFMTELIAYITPFLQMLSVKYPAIFAAFTIMGIMRSVFKPLMVLLDTYVLSTPSESDDKKLAEFKEGKVFKVIKFLVDYVFSIKITKAK